MAVLRNSATLPLMLLPMKRLTILLAAAVASIPAVGQKTVLDGNILQTKCASYEKLRAGYALSDEETASGAFCIGYIRGVLDTMITWKAFEEEAKLKSPVAHPCIPDGVSNEQAIKVTLKFLKDRPEQLHLPADSLVFQAMRQAFPCT